MMAHVIHDVARAHTRRGFSTQLAYYLALHQWAEANARSTLSLDWPEVALAANIGAVCANLHISNTTRDEVLASLHHIIRDARDREWRAIDRRCSEDAYTLRLPRSTRAAAYAIRNMPARSRRVAWANHPSNPERTPCPSAN